MSRAPHATPHAHTRAHTPSHARPFSPAASRARESQDGRREGPQRAPPSPAGAATRGGPRSQSRAVGCPSSMPPTSGPSMPVLPRPAPPGPDGSGPPGAGGGSCGPGVPRGGDTGGLPEQLVCACGAEYTRRHTRVQVCRPRGSRRSSLLGGEWVPGPVPTSCAAQGRTCRCLGGWREGRGKGEEAGAARPEPGAGPGHSTAWSGGPGAVAGGGGHWAGEPCGRAPHRVRCQEGAHPWCFTVAWSLNRSHRWSWGAFLGFLSVDAPGPHPGERAA